MQHSNSNTTRSLSDSPTTNEEESLIAKTADRLARKYGEMLDVSDVAHLLGTSEPRIQRWLFLSASGRALRARGVKIGRCVQWPVLVVAEFVVRGISEDAA